jgi:hypothetical protein
VLATLPRKGEAVDPAAEKGGQERHRRQEHERDCEHHAGRHRAEGRDGHEEDGREADEHRDAAEEDGLAGRVHRHPGGIARVIRRRVQCAAVARHDEERVVDAERDGEHHREVQRPDAEVGELRDAVETPIARPAAPASRRRLAAACRKR